MELGYQLWPSQLEESAKLVLLHGMGGTGALWRPVAVSLENHFTLLAPDQRGHGKSIIPHLPGSRTSPSYTPLDYGQDVAELIEKLDFAPTWILGHSMGVRTACATAHLDPKRVSGLILVDLGFSGVAGGGLGDGLAVFLRKLPQSFATREEARLFMSENCPDPAIAQYLMAVSVRTPEGEVRFPFDHAALIKTIEAARDVSVRAWVRELGGRGMPILVLRGAQSLVWSREEFLAEKRALADFASVELKEIEGAGHGLPFEKRALFTHEVREFIMRARPA